MKGLKLITALGILAGSAAALLFLPLREHLDRFLHWVQSLGPWGPIVVGAAYIPATVLFFPGSILTLGAGFAFGVVAGTIAVSLGSILGSTAAFLVGRFLARDWVSSRVKGNPRFLALDRAVGESGFKIVLLTRLSPIFPYNLLGYAFGITRIRLSHYFLASWIGMFPGTVMYVYIGSAAKSIAEVASGGTGERSPLQWALFGLGLLATVAVTVMLTRVARRALGGVLPPEPGSESGAPEGEKIHG